MDTTAVHGIADTGALVVTTDARLSDARAPTGSAGRALTGTYPNPTLAAGVLAGPAINVKEYGATGDGTTGDRAALQSAIDGTYAVDPRAAIFFPPGTHLIGSPLLMRASAVICLRCLRAAS